MTGGDITDSFVTYELAVLLKEAGFDQPALACYGVRNELDQWDPKQFQFNLLVGAASNWNGKSQQGRISAPTWEQAIDWLKGTKHDELLKTVSWAARV